MKITANSTQEPFKPTDEMITAAQNLFLAIGYEKMVRPIVEGYQRKILGERKWEVNAIYKTGGTLVENVTDIKLTWLMKPDEFDAYIKRCNEERVAANLESAIDAGQQQEDFCPLLVASDRLRFAKIDLIASMACVTNINGDLADLMSPADYDRVIEFTLNLLAPFVTNPLVQKT